MQIVGGLLAFLASVAKHHAEMGFKRRFVGRKTDVAIDAIHALLWRDSGKMRIETRYFGNQHAYLFQTLTADVVILFFMHTKPLTVIVNLQRGQKVEHSAYSSHSELDLWLLI